MLHPTVKHLYKYQQLDSGNGSLSSDNDKSRWRDVVEMINRGAGRFSIPSNKVYGFNDPFDCNLDCVMAERHQDQAVTDISETLAWFVGTRIHATQMAHYGIFSLSENCDDMLMWSHYAHQHRGICIEYERTENNILGDDAITRPVHYTNVYPKLSHEEVMSLVGKGPAPLNNSLVSSYLLTKSACWQYEREWRAIKSMAGCDPRELVELHGVSVTGVMFGINTPSEWKKNLREAIEVKGISFRRATKGKDRFEIIVTEETWE